jgi:hypothetical protein
MNYLVHTDVIIKQPYNLSWTHKTLLCILLSFQEGVYKSEAGNVTFLYTVSPLNNFYITVHSF